MVQKTQKKTSNAAIARVALQTIKFSVLPLEGRPTSVHDIWRRIVNFNSPTSNIAISLLTLASHASQTDKMLPEGKLFPQLIDCRHFWA